MARIWRKLRPDEFPYAAWVTDPVHGTRVIDHPPPYVRHKKRYLRARRGARVWRNLIARRLLRSD